MVIVVLSCEFYQLEIKVFIKKMVESSNHFLIFFSLLNPSLSFDDDDDNYNTHRKIKKSTRFVVIEQHERIG